MSTASGRAASEAPLVERLRAGDELAFRELVSSHHAALVRFARTFVPSDAVAEEVVQEAWLGVVTGIDRFEGRSSLRTWLYRIVANIARTRGERERRTVPASSLQGELDDPAPSVPPERFAGPPGRGGWANPPTPWDEIPEERLSAEDTLECIRQAVVTLPENQRRVFVLRDVDGWSSTEVCDLLELSEVNQRVLLHRARSKVRAALEQWVEVAS